MYKRTKLRLLIKIIVRTALFISDIYPLIFGGLIVHGRFVRSTSAFLDLILAQRLFLSKQKPDFVVISLWLSIIICASINYIVKGQQSKLVSPRLREFFAGLPNFDVLKRTGRVFFDDFSIILEKLKKYDSKVNDGTIDDDIQKIEIELNAVLSLIQNIGKEFFLLNEIGVNFMVYCNYEGASKNEKKKLIRLLNTFGIYNRPRKRQYLLGVLYLTPQLNFPMDSKLKKNQLAIPIYKENAQAYNDKSYKGTDAFVPGAPTAFFKETHIVEDTQDMINYTRLNSDTKDEVRKYFVNRAFKTKSLISLRIYDAIEKEVSGILNIEISQHQTRKFLKSDYATFYSIIYPALNLSSRYISHYKKYLFSTLKSHEK